MITEFKEEYCWLSNFHPCKIILNNLEYPSVEHAYQSAKSNDIEWKKYCQNSNNYAGKIKINSKNIIKHKDWEDHKITIMYLCLIQKFEQEPFKTKLIQTKHERIKEGNNWGDKFWGIDIKTSRGENVLGRLIEKIRTKLIQEKNGKSKNTTKEKFSISE